MRRGSLGMLFCLGLLVSGEALAIVGRPLTPVSYAGVARRTTRRTAYTAAAVTGAAAASTAAAVGTAAAVSTLPMGCVQMMSGGVVYQHCGATYYRPVYQGPNLVYIPTAL